MLQISSQQRTEKQRPWEISSAAEFYAGCIGFLRRQFSPLVLMLLVSLALGVAYIWVTEPRYTSRATLIIDAPKIQLFQSQQPPAGDSAMSTATVDTQIEVLKSDDIALSVIKELRLDEDPEFISPRPGIRGTITGFAMNAIHAAWHTVVPLGSQTANKASPEYRALQTFHQRLKVNRVGGTYAIDIHFESRDRFRAAEVANAIADAYELNAFQAKYRITDRAATWLQDRLQELREQASNAERAVVDYETNNNIVVDTQGRLMNEQQLAEFNRELIHARAATAEAKARLDRVEEIVASGNVDPDGAATATVADTLRNDVINKLRTLYLDNERRATQWAARYGAGHLAVVTLRTQMNELRHSIFEELKRTAESYKSDFAIAEAREGSIQQSLDHMANQAHTTDAARITLRNLKGSAQTARDLYDNFLQRYLQSVQQQSSPVLDSRLITHARPSLTPSWPKPLLIMALASLGGLIFGAAAGMLRDISDRVFRTTKQISDHLQANCIAVIPRVGPVQLSSAALPRDKRVRPTLRSDVAWEPKLLPGMPKFLLSPFIEVRRTLIAIPQKLILTAPPRSRRRGRRTLRREQSVSWMVTNAPFSRFSESIRTIKVAADSNIATASKTIGITSSLPNEGKSTVALSLATIINQGGGRAVLVDCDLRNPALSLMLTPDAKAGLLEIIAGKATIEDVLWREPATGLAFVPTVLTTRVAHSSDILASKETRYLFDQLRVAYDYVIVDLSPLAPVVDVRVMTPLVDSFLFVVEWGHTKIEVAQHALTTARGVCDNLLGIVLNKADMRTFARYANDQTSYYINSCYSRYGYTD
jgi:polysaccharide biosynthesis transport protein